MNEVRDHDYRVGLAVKVRCGTIVKIKDSPLQEFHQNCRLNPNNNIYPNTRY